MKVLVLLFCVGVSLASSSDCSGKCRRARVGIVGGGFSGTTASFLFGSQQQLANSANANLQSVDMSDILLFESQAQLGGDA